MKPIFLLLLIAATPVAARPASLDIATDCGATPDDGTDDTAAIRACIALQPRELVIPLGVFHVNTTSSSQSAALEIETSDTVVRGEGPGSVTRLIRDENNFSQSRVWGVSADMWWDVERVTFRDFTIDGGRDDSTCLDVKHTPGSSDGKGQQQHGLFIRGQGVTARDIVVERVHFTGLSGDAIFVYQSVEDYRLVGQTVGGYCRAGIAFNAYTDCEDDPTQGMRRVTLSRNTFMADPTATQGARGIDIEPNASVCDFLIADNVTDDIEVGDTVRMRIEGNTITDVGAQLGGNITVVSARDFVIRGNTVRGRDVVTPPLYILKSHTGTVEGNRIYQPYPVEGIGVSNHGSLPSRDIVISNNRVEYTGAGTANTYAIRTQGIEGRLDVVGNTIAGGWGYGVHVFGAGDARVEGNLWNVANDGVRVRSNVGGLLETKTVVIEGNRGAATWVFTIWGAVQTLIDCGNSSTGAQSLGGNTLTACSPAEAQAKVERDGFESRLQVLEAGQ